MTEKVTRRLHVSGLTPALSSSDISTRLSTFGTVKSLDGFGKLDGVGQPRKFGYVTLETTPQALKRCLTTLSGSTWKGARLRIGEAKPDYAERLQKERDAAEAEPPKKKRRVHHGKYSAVLAENVDLVTRENVTGRSGWKEMPSGRIVRAMRMRPERPLPELPGKDVKKVVAKKKKRIREPDSRARRRKIDVTRWDGTYIRATRLGDDEEVREAIPKPFAKSLPPSPVPISKPSAPAPVSHLSTAIPTATVTLSADLQAEKSQTLSFLHSLFDSAPSTSTKTTEAFGATVDWDSDIDLDDVEAQVVERKAHKDDDDDEFEIVPQDSESVLPDHSHVDDAAEDEDAVMDVDEQPQPTPYKSTADRQAHVAAATGNASPEERNPPKKSNTLKDLFAPREDEGGFSLLNHLDLELDEDFDLGLDFAPAESTTPANIQGSTETSREPAPVILSSTIPVTGTSSKNARPRAPIVLDPKKPMFFPRLDKQISFTAGSGSRALALSSPFYDRPTDEQIQQRWEDSKLELTRAWKKRWKEAGKIRKRKGGSIGEEEDAS
ncbi:hypothetical protein D9758_011588 [Tetrapyrgos nigripes]|uniref:RRM domain-containing protein n=1 Tax=Tetrapyrgos nigripes TaxID=182062 RepID=A0A8H5CN52_9AGAR|nr:hypothetical protein D9758_011588 [Tetrapyrgos nigripes]